MMQRIRASVRFYFDATGIYASSIVNSLKRILSESEITTPVEVTHLIPEVQAGRLHAVNSESKHIVFAHVSQSLTADDAATLSNHKGSLIGSSAHKGFINARNEATVINPRGLFGGPQNNLDDTNCGRYVTAMTIQAAGLASDGIPINEKTLMDSPVVKRAHQLSTPFGCYIRPLSTCDTPELKVQHHQQTFDALKKEYSQRVNDPNRAYHGTTSFFSGFRANMFTKILPFSYSAAEKSTALNAFETQSKNANFNLKNFQKEYPAAKHGALGDCIESLCKAKLEVENNATTSVKPNETTRLTGITPP